MSFGMFIKDLLMIFLMLASQKIPPFKNLRIELTSNGFTSAKSNSESGICNVIVCPCMEKQAQQ